MRTKEQIRSEFALNKIEQKFNGRVAKDTANFIVGMPTMILTNGLGQSLAFLLSKSDQKHKVVFDIIKEWLTIENSNLSANSDIGFLGRFSTIEQKKYLEAQNEALAMLNWLKRYARAFEE